MSMSEVLSRIEESVSGHDAWDKVVEAKKFVEKAKKYASGADEDILQDVIDLLAKAEEILDDNF